MKELDMRDVLKEFSHLPRFPDGRIDYSHSDKAPVLTCFVKYHDKILLLKRSDKVRAYQGQWNTVAGYLDEEKSLTEKVLEELKEELGITQDHIHTITIGKPYTVTDHTIKKTWVIHPVLVELKKQPHINLDWEHTEYTWIKPEEITTYDIVQGLNESFRKAQEGLSKKAE